MPNIHELESCGAAKDTHNGAVRSVVAISLGAVVKLKKDVLHIARYNILTAVDLATKNWWSRRDNSSNSLAVISTTRRNV